MKIRRKLKQDASVKISKLNDEFKHIFAPKLHDILQEDINWFPLWYCLNNYIINKYSERINIKKATHLKYKVFHFLRVTIFYMKQSLSKKDKDDLDVLFISRDRFVKIRTIDGPIKSDYLFYSIIHYLNKVYPHIKIGLLSTCERTPQNLNINVFRVYQYVTIFDFLKSILFFVRKKMQWVYYKNKNFKSIKEYNHMNKSIVSLTNSFFNFKSLISSFIRANIYSNAFNNLKPKIIVSNDDTIGIKPKINSKFITLQSASMLTKNEYYRRLFFTEFGSNKIKLDYFLCSGTYFKELKEFSKTSKKIVVTGSPRYDVLYYADKIYNKERFCKRYKINPNHKIILWTTQTHGLSYEENIKNLEAVFGTLEKLENTTLIVKQHPGEQKIHTKLIKKYLKKYKTKAIIIPKYSDTYEQIFVCDLMITRHSTTAVEAVALNKPVIILNLSGEPDPVSYVKEGVALGVYKDDDLKPAIEKLLKDDSELAKNRKKFIREYLYKIDGKATERVVNLIKKMIEQRRSKKGK